MKMFSLSTAVGFSLAQLMAASLEAGRALKLSDVDSIEAAILITVGAAAVWYVVYSVTDVLNRQVD